MIHVSRQAISKWELGESKPDIDNILMISKIFDVSTDYLLKDDEPRIKNDTPINYTHEISVKILYITSTALIVIGWICGICGWYEQPTLESIAGSMIIQIVGIVSYFIAKIIASQRCHFYISFFNLIVLLFMPISMMISMYFESMIKPYPTNIYTKIIFFVLYGISVIICYLYLKKRYAKSQHIE